MKALLLIAGMGSRLMPLTADRPQCLLELQEGTILKRTIRQLESNGVTEIYLVIGHGKEKVMEEVEKIKRSLGVSIKLIDNKKYKTTNNIYSLWLGKEHLHDGFLLIDGDVVFDNEILKEVIRSEMGSLVVMDPHRAPEDEDVKIAVDSNGIVGIGKGLNPYKSHGISVGIHKFSKECGEGLFLEIESFIKEGKHNVFYEEAIEKLAGKHRIDALAVGPNHKWEDVDFLDEYETVRHTFR